MPYSGAGHRWQYGACWMIKATHTHSEYVIRIAFPLQQWLHGRTWMSRCTVRTLLVIWTLTKHIRCSYAMFATLVWEHWYQPCSRGHLKCDGTRAETRFRLSAKRMSPFKSVREGRQFSRLLAAEVCASAVVMLDTPCSEVVWRVLATHCIRQFPLHFPSRASPCAITFQLESYHIKHWLVLCH